jgi:hypothetical protein
MTLFTDDGKVKSTWLLDRLGRAQMRDMVPPPLPQVPFTVDTVPTLISDPSIGPSGSSSSHEPYHVPVSVVAGSGSSVDLFSRAESGFGGNDDSWFEFISEMTRKHPLEVHSTQ